MNYLQELKAFEDWCDGNPLSVTSYALWHKLMAICNRCGWSEWFSIDNRRLMASLGIGNEKTIIRARDALLDAGLLEYKKGKKGSPNKYHLVSFHCQKYSIYDSKSDSKSDSISAVKTTDINKLNKTKLNKTKLNKKIDVEERACAREEISSSENSSAEEADKGMAVVEYYRKLTGHDVTPNRLQLIDRYIKDGAEPELICALLDYAVESNVRNIWQYTEAALMSCMDRGIYTLAAYREEQEQRKQERGRANGQATGVAESNTGGNAEENHDPRFGTWV